MQRYDWQYIFALGLLAIFIWIRDLSWSSTAADTLPILVALPLFYWLGAPWIFYEKWASPSKKWVAAATVFFLLGILTNLTILLSIGFASLLFAWVSKRCSSPSRSTQLKLLILPLMAFPWITLDAITLGWWFRLSSATITAGLFSLFGSNVTQEGTNLVINNIPISVEAACAGLNTLQAMLIAGSATAFILLGEYKCYWWNLPALIVIAWVANTLRILVLTAAALFISPEFSVGAFHTWGGWLVIALMFALCWLLFSLQEEPSQPKVKL